MAKDKERISSPVDSYTTTEGRAHLPDILQDVYGDKAMAYFDRYNRTIGAVIPIEAVRILAEDEPGSDSKVDSAMRERIRNTAQDLLALEAENRNK